MVDGEMGGAFLVVYTKCFKLCRALVFHVCIHEVMGPGHAVSLYCITLGFCSYSSMEGDEDGSECGFKEQNPIIGFVFAPVPQSSQCLG